MRVLALVTEAFGGFGGISVYNRDLLTALCALPHCTEVVALPRLRPAEPEPEPLPPRLSYVTESVGGKARYVMALLRRFVSDRAFDLIVCGHINLLPLAYLARRMTGAPVLLMIYGIDAWQPTASGLSNRLARRVDRVVSISDHTRRRFLNWTGSQVRHVYLLPNAIHAERYGTGPKEPALLRRYRLDGRTVLLTLGRLDAAERYKGIDEMLEVLPALAGEIPGLAYLVVGDGDDRLRLQQKAQALGVSDRVVFAGRIEEGEKADHYRLADAFVMPGRGEGFGFVFLEAMACGVPVVASTLDGSREAVRDGALGLLVDPDDRDALRNAITQALRRPKAIPPGLDYFSFERFTARLSEIVSGYP
ncbi:MAG: glycosyltransferase family 4 protein [Chromatiaceae bacterium]|nr:glycosyltransferase family 4 protein [Chromatiaceae bacterium]